LGILDCHPGERGKRFVSPRLANSRSLDEKSGSKLSPAGGNITLWQAWLLVNSRLMF
jgi:hypothetical protein